MFYYIEGKATIVLDNAVVLDCGGVGYLLKSSQHTIDKVTKSETIKLYTFLHVKEDIFDIYGFFDIEELNCFKMLLDISGVGPKAALSVLSELAPEALAMSILTGDDIALSRASGIGKKTAQRIILELKDKLSKTYRGNNDVKSFSQSKNLSKQEEAMSALLVLGYSPSQSALALKDIDENSDVEQMIKAALKKLV